jgi:hypothetical protein
MKKYVRKFEEETIRDFDIKESFEGEFKTYSFFKNNLLIGKLQLRLKRGWNQLHIDIFKEYQNKGYSVIFIEYIIDKNNYISIPEGRIVNDIIYKIIDKFKKNRKYEIWQTKFDEYIISNKKIKKKEIEEIFN